jgi:hypothetical protein
LPYLAYGTNRLSTLTNHDFDVDRLESRSLSFYCLGQVPARYSHSESAAFDVAAVLTSVLNKR